MLSGVGAENNRPPPPPGRRYLRRRSSLSLSPSDMFLFRAPPPTYVSSTWPGELCVMVSRVFSLEVLACRFFMVSRVFPLFFLPFLLLRLCRILYATARTRCTPARHTMVGTFDIDVRVETGTILPAGLVGTSSTCFRSNFCLEFCNKKNVVAVVAVVLVVLVAVVLKLG